jgi:hypothetical protein
LTHFAAGTGATYGGGGLRGLCGREPDSSAGLCAGVVIVLDALDSEEGLVVAPSSRDRETMLGGSIAGCAIVVIWPGGAPANMTSPP